MNRLPFFIRLVIVLTLIAVDAFFLGQYVKANKSIPFQFSPLIQRVLPPGILPTPTPAPPAEEIEIDETDWQGNMFVGKLVNHNDYPVFNTEIIISVSPTQTPWNEEKNHVFSIPSVIEAGQTVYITKRIISDNKEFWWNAKVSSALKYNGEKLDSLPKDVTVSTKKSRAPSQSTPQKTTPATDNEPWGVARQLDEVTWTIKVAPDERMATPKETLDALNSYRQRHGSGPLTWDDRLAAYASERAKYLNSIKSTDKHQGFKDYIANEDNVKKLGFWGLGENSGYGHKLLGVHLIEWIYAGDEGHNKNQLDTAWSHVGIGIEGLAVVFIFGGWQI